MKGNNDVNRGGRINDSTEAVKLQLDVAGFDVRNVTPWERQAEVPATEDGFGATLAARSVTTFAGDAAQRRKR